MTKSLLIDALCIVLGSAVYALSTVLFIFPQGLLLGGTSGISVILTHFLNTSPGLLLLVINFALLVLALVVLGKEMAVKTFFGSALTTVFVSLFERLLLLETPPLGNAYLSAIVGAALIALSSAVMFYVDSNSGGTDIIALIIRKYSTIEIGKALLITDVLIVVVGGVLSGLTVAIASFIGLLIKTLGIDLVIHLIRRARIRKKVG